ncbi:MFS-type transporter SLC18B1 [Halotydeus destructor]|nr:MFS-type transporter SLC18B1 [Halotydeus destructor]
MMVMSPVSGYLLPRVGGNLLITSGLLITGGAQIVFGTLTHIDDSSTFAILCFFVRSVGAVGSAMVFTASATVICQLFPEKVGFALAISETMIGIGMSGGPALGGILYAVGGFGLPFYFVGAVVLLSVPIAWVIFRSQDLGMIRTEARQRQSMGVLCAIRDTRALIVMIGVIVCSISLTFLEPTYEPHVRIFDLQSYQVGLIFFTAAGLYAIFSPINGYLSDLVKSNYIQMTVGQIFVGVAFLLIGPSPVTGVKQSLTSDILSIILVNIACASAMIPTFKMLLSAITDMGAPDDLTTYSLVSGLWGLSFNLGEVLGTSMGGIFVDYFGFVKGSTIVAIFNFATALLLIGAHLTRRRGPRGKIGEKTQLLSVSI